jgi:hypothetical protein
MSGGNRKDFSSQVLAIRCVGAPVAMFYRTIH